MANMNLGNLGAVLKNSGMSEDQKKRIAMMNGVDLGQSALAGPTGKVTAQYGNEAGATFSVTPQSTAGLRAGAIVQDGAGKQWIVGDDYKWAPYTGAGQWQGISATDDVRQKLVQDWYDSGRNPANIQAADMEAWLKQQGRLGAVNKPDYVLNAATVNTLLGGLGKDPLPQDVLDTTRPGGMSVEEWQQTHPEEMAQAAQVAGQMAAESQSTSTAQQGAESSGGVAVGAETSGGVAADAEPGNEPTMGKLGSTSGGTTPQQDYLADYEESMFGSVTSPWTETPPTVDPFQYGDAPTYGGSQYDTRRDQLLDQLEGSKFTYDQANDPVWQAYQKQYRREGQRAAEDALGRAAAATGGVASSYAATAAAQAGNYYASQLADKIPQLYNDAYSRYLAQYEKQLGLADRYNQYGQQDYQKFRDELSQFNTDRNFAYGAYTDQANRELEDYLTRYQQYLDEQNRLERERSWAYGVDQDAKKRTWDEDEREYGRAWDEDERTYKREQDAEERARQDRLDQISMAEMGAKYGDYSGLQGFGIDTSNLGGIVYAYAADGSTYNIGSAKGQYFIANAAPGQTMQGGDGSMWTKNADGGVTITKNGKTYTISAQQMMVEAATSGSGGSSGSSGGGGNRYSNLDYAGMRAAGLTNEAQIYNWFKSNGFSDAATQTKYYLAWLKEQEEADQDLAQNIQNDYSTAQVMRMIHGDGQRAVAMPGASGAAPSTSSTAATSEGGGKTDIVNLSEGYRSWWPKIRDAFTGGASTQEVAGMIYNLALQGVLNDNDINAMLDQLGI